LQHRDATAAILAPTRRDGPTATPGPRPGPGDPPIVSGNLDRGFRPDVEGMRAVAVVAVIAYHMRIPGFGGGFVGVDVFFVLSGFLITPPGAR